MKYESETGAGRAIERAVKHLDSLEKVCKNDANSIVDMDDSIVVKMPHIVSFRDSLAVIQLFQSMRSEAFKNAKFTEAAVAYIDAAYDILSEYARALAIAENEGGCEVATEEIKEATADTVDVEHVENGKEIYKVFDKDIIYKAANMDDFVREFDKCLGKKGSCDIMNDIACNSVLSLINIDTAKMAKYINESKNIVGYLVAVLDVKAYDEAATFTGDSFTYWVGGDDSDEIGCVYLDEHPEREEADNGANLIFNFDIMKSGCADHYFQYAKDFYFILCNVEKCDESALTVDNTILNVMKLDKGRIPYSSNRCTVAYNIDPIKY